jgi:hypothetical protein
MTAYTTIYNSFLDKVNDYDLADMTAELAQTSMRGWLNQAVVRFLESCKKDLTQTDEGGFTEDLDLMEIDILTEGMVEAWLKPIRNNLDLLRNALSTKDFTTFSPANLLDKVNDTYSMAHANFLSRIKEYSFIRNDVGDLI